MVKKIINTGTEGNDATGDPIREAFTKTNENFTELYSFIGKGDGLPFTSLSDYDSNRGGEGALRLFYYRILCRCILRIFREMIILFQRPPLEV
jgi:hypothetical protein